MPAPKWTPEQRDEALRLYTQLGAGEAARQTGIPQPTISSWARRAGVQSDAPAKTAAAVEQARLTMEARKAQLALDLMDDIQQIRAQLFAPCVERKAMVVSDGAQLGSHVEVIDVERDQPSFGDQKAIMTTLAIAVDKVQILTGEATERIDHTGLPLERPVAEERLAKILQIADRRAS